MVNRTHCTSRMMIVVCIEDKAFAYANFFLNVSVSQSSVQENGCLGVGLTYRIHCTYTQWEELALPHTSLEGCTSALVSCFHSDQNF